MIFNPLIPVQGNMWPGPIPAAQGTRQDPNLDRMPFWCRVTHTSTLTHTGTIQTCWFTSRAHLWGMG